MRSKQDEFKHLVEIMARLRGPDGCPWDKEQTHRSLKQYLLEEAYEVLEAIDKKDLTHLREELGDLLLQIVFHAQIAAEKGRFTIDDILGDITLKLERRHPHVFGEAEVSSSEGVVERWEAIKREEKESASALEGVPKSLPALLCALKLQSKAAGVGFDWEKSAEVIPKLKEEVKEIEEAITKGGDVKEEIGDLLFSVVNLARRFGVNPELSLREICGKFQRRFEAMEIEAKKKSQDFKELSLAEKDRLWEEVKKKEKKEQ